MSVVSWVIIVSMVFLNALLAAYEIALASITVSRLKSLAEQHRTGARSALAMKTNMESSLAVVQLGITLVGAIAAAVGGANGQESISPWLQSQFGLSEFSADGISLMLIVIPLAAVTIVVGELIPKLFALKHNEWVCLKLSGAMRALSLVAWPAVWFLEGTAKLLMSWGERRWQPSLKSEVSEMQELRAVVALARTSRMIGGQEERIILGAARLSGRMISEIMIPVNEIITLDLEHSMSESLVIAHLDMHTRFPICAQAGEQQSICGYVNFKDIVSELRLSPDQPSLRGIMRTIPEFNQSLSIGAVLERMIRDHVHIAIVRDANRSIVGMVTMEDILEELVGDILDEYDRSPTHVVESGHGWVSGGGVPLDRLEQVIGSHFRRPQLAPEIRTLNDWIRAQLGRPPRGGDIVRSGELRVVIRKVRRQQVLEAQLSLDHTHAKMNEAPPISSNEGQLPGGITPPATR